MTNSLKINNDINSNNFEKLDITKIWIMKSALSLHAGSSQEYSKSTNEIHDETKTSILTKKWTW